MVVPELIRRMSFFVFLFSPVKGTCQNETSVQLTRICNGFLSEPYNDDDISRIVCKRELFFLETPLRIIRPGSKLYKQFLAFDRPFPLPAGIHLPRKRRGFAG